MPASRNYSSTAGLMRLVGGITGAAASLIVDVTTGLPSVPFTLLLDPGLGVEEVVTVTAVGGTTLTVTRGVGGTSAQAHDPGAEIRHAYYGADFQDSRDHEAATTAHGATGGIPGTGLANTWSQNQTFSANITAANLFKATRTLATANVGPTSGITALPVLSAPAVTGDGAKRFRISASIFKVAGTVDGDEFILQLRDENLTSMAVFSITIGNGKSSGRTISATQVPTAGTHTYTLAIYRVNGTGTATVVAAALSPLEIIVEQI